MPTEKAKGKTSEELLTKRSRMVSQSISTSQFHEPFFGEDDIKWDVINTAAAGQSLFDRHPGACKAWTILDFLYLFLKSCMGHIYII